MKRLIIAISLIVSAACAGTPLEDAVKAGDWTNAARLVTYKDTGPINAGNVRQIYAAAKQLKLDQKTAIAAYKALSLGDTELFQGFLDTVEVKYNENAGGWPSFSPNAYSWIFTNKQDSVSWRKSENGKYVEVNLNEQFPEMMLAFYQKRAAAGDYMAVLHAVWNATNYGALELAPHMTKDWRKVLDVITPEILDTCPDIFLIRHFLNYVKASKGLAVRDTFITSRFMRLNALKSKVINPSSNKKKPEILEAYIQYSPILGIRI